MCCGSGTNDHPSPRGTEVLKPSGGHDFRDAGHFAIELGDDPRPPQTVSLGKIGNDVVSEGETAQQQYVLRNYVLTGRWNMVIEVGDMREDAEANCRADAVNALLGSLLPYKARRYANPAQQHARYNKPNLMPH